MDSNCFNFLVEFFQMVIFEAVFDKYKVEENGPINERTPSITFQEF